MGLRRLRVGWQCPYAAQVWDWSQKPPIRILTRCMRNNVLGSSGWHLHAAIVPGAMTHRGILLRWRSTSAPDYHVDYERGSADHILNDPQ